MGGFGSIAAVLLMAFTLGLPVLVFSSGVFASVTLMRREFRLRRAALRAALVTTGFVALDTLLLNALPWLGLSFGPPAFSWMVLFGLRAALLTAWLILLLQVSRRIAQPRLLPLGLLHALVTLLVVYGFYIEPFHIRTTHLELPVPARQLARPLRLVQISDLHVERTTSRERNLVSQVQRLKPDLILLTGDYLNLSYLGDPIAMRDARAVISQLSAPYGIYAVNGSVDNEDRMDALFEGMPVTVLTDDFQQVSLPGSRMYVMGVTDWERQRDENALRELSSRVPADAYRLLLYHTPDLAPAAARGGVDLYLAGHTHGGQICMPLYGAIVTASIYGKAYEAGQYQVEEMTLYVSRGLGMEGWQAPRARFLSPPELVVIDLIPGQ